MKNKFAERLRELRKERKITQDELAEAIHVARCTVASYETRGRIPDPETLFEIADYFDVSLDYLLGRTDRI